MITGIDYIIYTNKNENAFFSFFEDQLSKIWVGFYKEADNEDGIYSVFYSVDKSMFDNMDAKGYFLNKDGEGPFYIIFNPLYCNNENRISLVLPSSLEDSPFCLKIFELVSKVSGS